MEIGDRVIVTLTNVEGVIVETLNNEVLVKHKAEIDGITKTVCQWYDGSIVKEVETTDKIEFNNGSVIQGIKTEGEATRGTSSKKIEFGIVPQEEQDNIRDFHSEDENVEE